MTTLHVQPPFGAGQALRLERGLLTIGRGSDCDLVLADQQASRHHAELRRYGDQWAVVDLGSTNGTFVDSVRLSPHQPQALAMGQLFIIGATQLALRDEHPPTPVEEVAWAPEPWPAPEAVAAAAESSPVLGALAWLGRLVVAAAGGLLIVGSQSEWVRISVQLPLLGTVFNQGFGGMDSGFGWLLIGVAALALFLALIDVLSRRWGLAAGLGQALLGVITAIALAATAYTYYQAGSQTVFGISLIDVLTQYARNVVNLSVQQGIYLVAAGLAGLIIGGILRLVVASMAEDR